MSVKREKGLSLPRSSCSDPLRGRYELSFSLGLFDRLFARPLVFFGAAGFAGLFDLPSTLAAAGAGAGAGDSLAFRPAALAGFILRVRLVAGSSLSFRAGLLAGLLDLEAARAAVDLVTLPEATLSRCGPGFLALEDFFGLPLLDSISLEVPTDPLLVFAGLFDLERGAVFFAGVMVLSFFTGVVALSFFAGEAFAGLDCFDALVAVVVSGSVSGVAAFFALVGEAFALAGEAFFFAGVVLLVVPLAGEAVLLAGEALAGEVFLVTLPVDTLSDAAS